MNKQYERFLDKSCFYTESEFIKMYGQNYRIFLNHDLLIKDEALFKRYKFQSPTITSTIQENRTTVSKTLLFDLLNNEGMYQYLFQNMDNDFGNVVRISLFKEDNKVDSIIISRAVLSDLLLSLPKDELSEKEQMRIALITSVSTLNSLRTKYRDEIHFGIVDESAVSIPSVALFNVLTMSNEKYNNFLRGDGIEFVIDGKKQKISSRIVAYMIVSFMERERILAKYLIPNTVYHRYMSLKAYKSIDFESINRNEKSNDYDQDGASRADLVELSDELQEALDKDIPKTLSALEIAIIKYIRLLSILEYNQDYYASNISQQQSSSVEDVKSITLENNAVLPNDIMIIMSYIFKQLGIKYTVEFQTLSFKYGEYVLELDLSNEALLRDMSSAKMNEGINSIKCINTNQTTKNKFEELLAKINYTHLVNASLKRDYIKALDEYRSVYARASMSRKERLFMFFKVISSSSLMGTDSIVYQLKMFENFFRPEDGISISVVSSSINTYREYEYVPITIVSVVNSSEYTYFVIDANSKEIISNLNIDEIRSRFDDKRYAYLDVEKKDIPGVIRSKTYVR